ncbi:MAG: hypothetical protein E5V17_03690, partial [Mesorhizobium sp.]|nr:hypothetical protein EN779_04145 [Mesorhizobium sp. M4B.F.Ca.ET.088.02.2.1]RWA60336.1 MAG: hypothetical protein EOQ27_22620 [Mesorhizobium sp.]RWF25641.1 MAG: hypothetical protein EOS45_30190 [Mesorhizobium sp.]RWF40780.1 MAG: hypothetical protein EOS65_14700 [Mesorhizobium sp.]TIX41740.1 MAG: hypothetical protein E5V40_09235 [Mesorhizobium sp.]
MVIHELRYYAVSEIPRVDFIVSSKSALPWPPTDIECASPDDSACQAQPNPLHTQHGAHHHG